MILDRRNVSGFRRNINTVRVSTYVEQVQVQVVYYFKKRNGRAGTKVKGAVQKISTRAKSRFRTDNFD